MKSIKTVILFLSALCCIQETFSQSVPSNVIGTWSGQVIEHGRSDYYNVKLTLNAGEVGDICGKIDYPDYSCGGNLKFLSINNSKLIEVEFREILSYGNELCIDQGQVVIALENNRLKFQWAKSGLDFQAEGYLNKQ